MKNQLKKAITCEMSIVLVLALLTGLILSMTTSINSKAGNYVLFSYPTVENGSFIWQTTSVEVEQTPTSGTEVIELLQKRGLMQSLEAYQKVDSSVTGFYAKKNDNSDVEYWSVVMQRGPSASMRLSYYALNTDGTINGVSLVTNTIPSSVNTADKMIDYLIEQGKMSELSEFQKMDPTILGFDGNWSTSGGMNICTIDFKRADNVEEVIFNFPVIESDTLRTYNAATTLGVVKGTVNTSEDVVRLLQERGLLKDISEFQRYFSKKIRFDGITMEHAGRQLWMIDLTYEGQGVKEVSVDYPTVYNGSIRPITDRTIVVPDSLNSVDEAVEYLTERGYLLSLSEFKNVDNSITGFKGSISSDKWTVDVARGDEPTPSGEGTDMYRLYNPHSTEHLYTDDAGERDWLAATGWNYEGIAWIAPKDATKPVYRLFNPFTGEHHYTTDEGERGYLLGSGWNDEGIGWRTPDSGTPVYRLFNPNNPGAGSHHYTTDAGEKDYLAGTGWNYEGIAWYGM